MRVVVLVSGSGTTLQNLLNEIHTNRLPITIVGVVGSKPGLYGIERATLAGIPTVVVEKAGGDHSERVFAAVRVFQPDFVCLAGWLHLLKIPPDFHHKVLNIHPSLLPAFGGKGMYGLRVHQAVIDYGAKISGCTVHFADDTYDTGPIVVQRAVPVEPTDTAQTLAARVFAAECVAYPEAIRLIAQGRVRVVGRRTV